MPEVPIAAVKQAIERLHHCKSEYRSKTRVVESFEGQRWEGEVYTFDLIGHPLAVYCYAWSSLVEGSEKRRFVAMLHKATVDSPEAAVRATIARECMTRRQ